MRRLTSVVSFVETKEPYRVDAVVFCHVTAIAPIMFSHRPESMQCLMWTRDLSQSSNETLESLMIEELYLPMCSIAFPVCTASKPMMLLLPSKMAFPPSLLSDSPPTIEGVSCQKYSQSGVVGAQCIS